MSNSKLNTLYKLYDLYNSATHMNGVTCEIKGQRVTWHLGLRGRAVGLIHF